MRKLLFVVLAALTALALAGLATAQTSGAHFTKGGTPVCTVSANGTATGLTCTSPGGNEAPGQNPAVLVTSSGSQTIHNPKNGRAGVDVTTAQPTVTPKQAGCPNNNWRVTIADVTFTTYTHTISQGGTTLFTCSGSFSSPSTNGQTSTPTC